MYDTQFLYKEDSTQKCQVCAKQCTLLCMSRTNTKELHIICVVFILDEGFFSDQSHLYLNSHKIQFKRLFQRILLNPRCSSHLTQCKVICGTWVKQEFDILISTLKPIMRYKQILILTCVDFHNNAAFEESKTISCLLSHRQSFFMYSVLPHSKHFFPPCIPSNAWDHKSGGVIGPRVLVKIKANLRRGMLAGFWGIRLLLEHLLINMEDANFLLSWKPLDIQFFGNDGQFHIVAKSVVRVIVQDVWIVVCSHASNVQVYFSMKIIIKSLAFNIEGQIVHISSIYTSFWDTQLHSLCTSFLK